MNTYTITQDADFCRWFTGFFDGEGSIMLHVRHNCGRQRVQIQAGISSRSDDRHVLELIRLRLGGHINDTERVRPVSKTMCPMSQWRLGSSLSCLVLVPIFDMYPLKTKKAREYELWRPAVLRFAERAKMAKAGRLQTHMPIDELLWYKDLADKIGAIKRPDSFASSDDFVDVCLNEELFHVAS